MKKDLKNIKAIIFDMDGVIVDSEPLHDEARQITCEKYGIKCPPRDPDWSNFKGKPVSEIFKYIVKEYNENDNLSIEELTDYKTKLFLKIASEKLQLIPGVMEFIKKCRGKYEKIALTTSARIEIKKMVFNKFDLDNYFDAVVTREEIKNGKPHPEPFLKTVSKINIPAENCLVIEDSDNGIISAKKAGCVTAGITTYFDKKKLKGAGADYVVDSFEELDKLINS